MASNNRLHHHSTAANNNAANDDSYGSDSNNSREEEKTIPFLRRLVDMLCENESVISFYPGTYDNNGQVSLGRIVVHDRLKVESEVLPRYFNHSSFASLRRQLNYFSFTRVGKGRQRGATYCNQAVVEMDDILKLKRRSTVNSNNNGNSSSSNANREAPSVLSSSSSTLSHLRQQEEEEDMATKPKNAHPKLFQEEHSNKRPRGLKPIRSRSTGTKQSAPTVISPRMSPVDLNDVERPKVTLDLTVPEENAKLPSSRRGTWSGITTTASTTPLPHGDADILAGCKALLSFSRGSYHNDEIGYAV